MQSHGYWKRLLIPSHLYNSSCLHSTLNFAGTFVETGVRGSPFIVQDLKHHV